MPLFEGERSEGGKRLGEGKGGDIFFHWSFYDPKKEICKISYCEHKVKLNNKDNSKYNVNKINQIIYSKYIIFISIEVSEFLAAGIYLLKLNNENSRARCAV